MSTYETNGYVAELLRSASSDTAHKDYAEAGEYYVLFRGMEKTFFESVHPQVDVGLAISETQKSPRPNIFTAHGPRHISDLVKSIDQIARAIGENNEVNVLSVLEAYILLCAAHVHDTGNVEKREDHPAACKQMLRRYKTLFSPVATQQIYEVASVHGGRSVVFGKDTIRGIDGDNTTKPRLPLLASILRLADELSENAERVPEEVLASHKPSEASKLAHAYARSFTKFELRKDTLFLTYNLYPAERDLKVGRNPTRCRSFIDYLESKIDCVELEARYCSQYGQPSLNVSKISVVIRTYKSEKPSPVDRAMNFELPLAHGYPTTAVPLCKRSKELREKGIVHLSDYLVKRGRAIKEERKQAEGDLGVFVGRRK